MANNSNSSNGYPSKQFPQIFDYTQAKSIISPHEQRTFEHQDHTGLRQTQTMANASQSLELLSGME